MATALTLVALLPVRPETIYRVWMSSLHHSEFTGSPAVIDNRVGGQFSAWNGYIIGKNLALEPGHRILQSWRTTDFPKDSPDSELELLLERCTSGTVFTLIHRNIPDGQIDDYRLSWEEQYLQPLKEYLEHITDGEDLH